MATVTRPFRGISADDRMTRRRALLLDAALDEVGEVGVAQLRMNTVCDRARLSRRYFYEHFGNRDELLGALFENVIDRVITETIAAVRNAGPDLIERAGVALGIFFDTIISDPRKARLYAESVGLATIADRKRAAVRRYSDFVIEEAAAFVGEMDDRTKARLTMAILVLVGGQIDAAVALAAGEIALPRDDYINLYARMLIDAVAAARLAPTP